MIAASIFGELLAGAPIVVPMLVGGLAGAGAIGTYMTIEGFLMKRPWRALVGIVLAAYPAAISVGYLIWG